jgi:hypothetical protein
VVHGPAAAAPFDPDHRIRHRVLAATAAGLAMAVLLQPPVPQPLSYHDFADGRPLLGIPNGLDVLSNVPFAVLGIAGMLFVRRRGAGPFAAPWIRLPYVTLFCGVALTAAGSGWYHLAPDNDRLVWDRLPMTIGFTGLLAAMLAERVSLGAARALFIPLLAVGAGSVFYWQWSESAGIGDLRPYLLVQGGSLALVLLMLVLYPLPGAGTAWLVAGLALYAAAKLLETGDASVFAAGGQLASGHTLKHLAAAGGVACLLQMLRVRVRLDAARRADTHGAPSPQVVP